MVKLMIKSRRQVIRDLLVRDPTQRLGANGSDEVFFGLLLLSYLVEYYHHYYFFCFCGGGGGGDVDDDKILRMHECKQTCSFGMLCNFGNAPSLEFRATIVMMPIIEVVRSLDEADTSPVRRKRLQPKVTPKAML
jgi:hypothetical protein